MSRGKLPISDTLSLPTSVATEKLAFLGRTGSGKTYAASKLAELLYDAGAQFVVLDPVGVWWGLRLAAGGKEPGIPVPVFGGLHGDLPLEPTAGKLVADLVVDRGISIVLDVSQFESDADKARFATAFAERFFHRKKGAPSAVHVFLEEAQEFIPQNLQRGEERMLHVWQRLVRLGRNFGIGASLISQRPQDVSKKALNMSEIVLAFQMTGPQERKAVDGWIAEKGLDLDIAADLPKLRVGHAHVWSPALLGISKEVAIAEKRTFNASSTPTVGTRSKVRDLAPIDLEQLGEAMRESVDKAKAEDPKRLHARIRELEAEAKKARPTDPQAIEKAVTAAVEKERRASQATLEEVTRRAELMAERITKELHALAETLRPLASVRLSKPVTEMPSRAAVVAPRAAAARRSKPRADGDPQLKAGAVRMLETLSRAHPSVMTRKQFGTLAGFTPSGGTFQTYFGALKRAEFLEDGIDGVRITQAGFDFLGLTEPPSPLTAEENLAQWRGAFKAGAVKMLDLLVDAYPKSLTRAELGDGVGMTMSGGTFQTYLGALKRNGLLEVSGDRIKVATFLMEGP